MAKLKDYTGERFGRLECVSLVELSRAKDEAIWRCKCDCGNIVDVKLMFLLNGSKKSCGGSKHYLLNQVNKTIIYNIKNPCLEQEDLTLELKVGDKVGVLFYDNPVSKAEIHTIRKVTLVRITLENGTQYNCHGKEIGASLGIGTTYLCTVEQAESIISQKLGHQTNESTNTTLEQNTAPVYKPTRLDIIIESLRKRGGSATCAEIAADTNIHYMTVGSYLRKLIVEDTVYKVLLKQNLKSGRRKDRLEYLYFLIETLEN